MKFFIYGKRVYSTDQLIALANAYSASTGLSLHTIARRAGIHNLVFYRLKSGGSCSARTAARLSQWFVDHADWWPPEVPRNGT